ncbi:MAG: gliding motility-associated C-terminal domain-containing protein [Chitinophagales bacterium]
MKRLLSACLFVLVSTILALGQPVNDEPCNAIALNVSSSCNFTQYTNASATASAGIPAPGCANYQGGDVWFTVVVPASGNLVLDGLQGVITDGAMAVYTATSCSGPFTLNSCDDDNSANGLMPYLNLTGLVPGSTIYVRFWEYGGDNNGTFSICAWDATVPPPPPSNACLSPVPDLCSTACDLGTLPSPPPCVSGTSISQGNTATFNLSNIGATAGNPYSQIGSCAAPSADVWYRFTATGTQLQIAINSDPTNPLNTPNVSLYNGNNCNALLPLVCYTGSGGNLVQQTYAPITPGDVYYLQIAGADPNDQGLFTLLIKNNYDCDNCLLADNLTATPAPTNGTYPPNTTVNFCYTVSNYNQTAANWLHGVDLNFGPGWNMSTLTPVSIPPSCATTTGAFWGFYQSVTGSNSGVTYGPGFFYETSSGNAGGAIDANPGNNFGDQGVGTSCPVTFCWSITTNPAGSCVNGTSLAVNINTLGDYESGSWSSTGCQNDPVGNFISTLSCCNPPTMASTTTSCGLNNGTATATGSAFGPWDYTWSNSSGVIVGTSTAVNGPNTISNLASGQYFVTVTDATGCTSTGNVQVQSSAGGAATASNTGPYCAGATISLDVTPAGISYTWSGPNSFSSTSQSPTISGATAAMAGAYNVTVTYTGGCTATATTTVTISNNLTPSVTPTSVAICAGGSTTLTASGGNTYAWSNSGSTAAITVSPASTTTYTVTVSNNGACSASIAATVTVNNAPTPSINPAGTAICSGGSATLTAGGGTSYLWSTTAVTAAITVSPANTTTYTVTVTDANTCTATTSATVTVNAPPTASIAPATPAICNGNSITLTASGGTSYLWNTTDATAAITASPTTTTTYSVTVTDANTCTASASVSVTVNNNPLPTVTPSAITVCNGTPATLTAAGGTSYLWSTTETTAAITVTPATTTTYTVTATDANTCTGTASGTVTVTQPFTLATVVVDESCPGAANGSIDLTVTGGTPNFSYIWNDGINTEDRSALTAGTYSVTVTDNSACSGTVSAIVNVGNSLSLSETHTGVSCNGAADGTIDITENNGTSPYIYVWNDGINTEDRTGLAAGTYTISVTDLNTCSGSLSVTIVEPAVLTVTETHIDIGCNGNPPGSIDVTVNGGTTPYVYLWNDGIATEDRTGLTAGTYSITVTDANSCTQGVTVTLTQPTPLTFTQSHTDANCFAGSDGTATITVTSGTPTYYYDWNGQGPSTNNTISGLSAGSVNVTVTDVYCSATATILISEPSQVQITLVNQTDISCAGGADGSIAVNANGGTPGYTYSWSNLATGSSISGLSAGPITVTATDTHGCIASQTYTITEPTAITASATATDALCYQAPNGTATVTASGGTPPYNYLWSDSQTTAQAVGLVANFYTVTVLDNHSCSTTASAVVAEPTDMVISYTATAVKCIGDKNGEITVNVTGGTNPYNYSATQDMVNFVSTTDGVIKDLAAGDYTVIISDNNGCTKTLPATVPDATPDAFQTTTDSTSCYGSNYNDGAAHIIATSIQNGPYMFSMDGGLSQYSGDFYYLSAGQHTITAYNFNGCESQVPVLILEPLPIIVDVTPDTLYLPLGESGQVQVTYLNASSVTYAWEPSLGLSCIDCPNPTVTTYNSRDYLVTVSEQNGTATCYGTATLHVDIAEEQPVFVPNSFTPNGDGNNDMFLIYGQDIKTVDLKIFNRWGELVFETTNPLFGWDGTYRGQQQQNSVYTYYVNITFLNNKKLERKGTITLIR